MRSEKPNKGIRRPMLSRSVCFMLYWKIGRRKFRRQTSKVWTDAAPVVRTVREERVSRKKMREDKESEERSRKIKVCKKAETARNTVFPMFCGYEGSKSRLAKAAGAELRLDERSKVAHGCGAKRVSKSKCQKHRMLGALLEMF